MTFPCVINLPEGVSLPKGVSLVEFKKQVFAQIIKDFQLDMSESQEPFNLWMEKTILSNPDRIQASFYRLDLGEESLINALKTDDVSMRSTLLAELSIKRAVLKVLTRFNYALKNSLNSTRN
jgi:hypothetical protein|tara:strand:+ start:104 stop:469 length:366 start_codon:yes stop_codon:yes gene_type:complete